MAAVDVLLCVADLAGAMEEAFAMVPLGFTETIDTWTAGELLVSKIELCFILLVNRIDLCIILPQFSFILL